jgi:nucleotide-binding universal stress UspA family protein
MPGAGHVEGRLEVSSSPSRGLLDTAVAAQADLIVVGSAHHVPVGGVLLGSVGERLLIGAPCAVAIAPRGHAARESREIA